jgi:hypothetical protein
MFKKPVIRLAILGMALLGSSVAWYLISPLFTSRQAYTMFPTLALMASATPRPATATPLPTATLETIDFSSMPQTQRVASGSFMAVAVAGSGNVEIYTLENGAHIVALEDVQLDAYPDLHVVLADGEVDASNAPDWATSLDLGLLALAEGDAQLALPADVELAEYRAVVLWSYPEQLPYLVAELEPITPTD